MKKIIIVALAVTVLATGVYAAALKTKSNNHSTQNIPKTNQQSQLLPTKTNPISNNSQTPGLSIVSAMVEDNVDPVNKQAISDRLQIAVQNTSTQTMSNFEIYYVMTDTKTGQKEAYYQKLTDLQLPAGQTKTIYFDNVSAAGHYPENQYSLYRSSKNEVTFTIQLSAPHFKLSTGTAKKSAGTGETAG